MFWNYLINNPNTCVHDDLWSDTGSEFEIPCDLEWICVWQCAISTTFTCKVRTADHGDDPAAVSDDIDYYSSFEDHI